MKQEEKRNEMTQIRGRGRKMEEGWEKHVHESKRWQASSKSLSHFPVRKYWDTNNPQIEEEDKEHQEVEDRHFRKKMQEEQKSNCLEIEDFSSEESLPEKG